MSAVVSYCNDMSVIVSYCQQLLAIVAIFLPCFKKNFKKSFLLTWIVCIFLITTITKLQNNVRNNKSATAKYTRKQKRDNSAT